MLLNMRQTFLNETNISSIIIREPIEDTPRIQEALPNEDLLAQSSLLSEEESDEKS